MILNGCASKDLHGVSYCRSRQSGYWCGICDERTIFLIFAS